MLIIQIEIWAYLELHMNLSRVKTFVQKFKTDHGQVWIDKSNWLLLVNYYDDYFLEKKKDAQLQTKWMKTNIH
jgi:hypothetical protein